MEWRLVPHSLAGHSCRRNFGVMRKFLCSDHREAGPADLSAVARRAKAEALAKAGLPTVALA